MSRHLRDKQNGDSLIEKQLHGSRGLKLQGEPFMKQMFVSLVCVVQILIIYPEFIFPCRRKKSSTMAYCTMEKEVISQLLLFTFILDVECSHS